MSPTPFELLEQLNRTDETERIEAKESRSGDVGRAAFKTLSAFSNEPGLDGGYLLFGVSRRDDGSYEAVGVEQPDRLQTQLASMCSEFNAPIRPRVQVQEQRGVCLVAAFVPEASRAQKPVYRVSTGLPGGAFRRNGSVDVRCTEEDLHALFAGRDGSTFDASVANATMADLDSAAIALYRDALRRRESLLDVVDWSDEDLLLGRACLRETQDGLVPTVAGLVLFGGEAALRREMPMSARVDYIRIPGTEWSDGAHKMTTFTARQPLVFAARTLVQNIIADLPRVMRFEGAVERSEEPLIPTIVIRETVVNALMHRDYRSNASVQIVRYDDRIEIGNPGYSLKDVAQLDLRGSSLRNPNIALVLYEMQLAEC